MKQALLPIGARSAVAVFRDQHLTRALMAVAADLIEEVGRET